MLPKPLSFQLRRINVSYLKLWNNLFYNFILAIKLRHLRIGDLASSQTLSCVLHRDLSLNTPASGVGKQPSLFISILLKNDIAS